MPMTITEKVLARSFGRKEVVPGEVGTAKVDVLMLHDHAWLSVLPLFKQLAPLGATVRDPDKVVSFWDRRTPIDSVSFANLHREVRLFCAKQNIKFYDIGRGGISHQVICENGHIVPGETAIGADSHTCTYGAFGCFATGVGNTEAAYCLVQGELWLRVPKSIKIQIVGRLHDSVIGKDVFLHVAGRLGEDGALYKAIEWSGPVVERMGIDSRMTLANMSVEIGAKNGIMEPNAETLGYLKARSGKSFEVLRSDDDARYDAVLEFDVTALEPQVALPFSPSNVKPVREVAGTRIDQAFIGSCTGGRLEDLRMGAAQLRGRKVHPEVRLIVIPASQEVYAAALKEGLIGAFIDAGAAVCTPSCGPCAGIDKGILGADEACLSTSNRNFRGRMGDPSAGIYLANAAVVAASSIAGRIVDPRE